MTKQTKTKDLNYLIDPTFNKVNRLFVLSFESEDDSTSFTKCYIPKVEIKAFNVLINSKSFVDVTMKNKEERYEKIIEMCKINNFATGNFLKYDFLRYFKPL